MKKLLLLIPSLIILAGCTSVEYTGPDGSKIVYRKYPFASKSALSGFKQTGTTTDGRTFTVELQGYTAETTDSLEGIVKASVDAGVEIGKKVIVPTP